MTTTIALRAPGQVTVKSVGLLADIGEHSAKRDLKPNPSAMNNSGPTLTQDLVHSLIQDQSRIKPDAVAVQFGTEVSLTYRQLNQLSNGVARQLVCGRGTIVPIATSRSVGMIVSLLAVLKTGAAYTLLSSDTPVDRSKLIIKDVGAPFVIVDETTEGSFNDSGEIKIEDLMSRAGISPPTLKEDLNIYQIPSDIAYVIFTSGTTGKPKGVLLSHGAAFTGLTALPPLDPKQPLRQLLCHSPNFSAAQRTIHGTLSRGGTLCITSKEKLTLQLRETIQQMDISSLEVTPSMLRLIKPSEIPGSIKKITLGGELTGPAIVDEWADKVELFTAYGLSECTMLNLRHRLMSGQDHQVIGKPSDSTTCYIMEPGTIRLVPDGETGELCLGGQQLAEGYLNLPEATARAFIANPFGSGRLYRTGDMAVANDSGIVRLIGRIDQQTKIDGQRVEPNESNSVLQLLPGVVSSCVVSAVVLGRKALVALVVAGNDRHWPVFVRELRASLQTQLPASSIPRYWIQQDTLPLNINGKVDVASLVKQVEIMDESGLITPPSLSPKSGTVQTDISDIFEHETVEVVASILSLSRSAIDLELSFQELGGGSLDAIVFASKLREKSIHISVSDVLQTTSLRELIKANQNFGTTPIMPPKPFSLLPSGVKLDVSELEDAYPVTPIQESVLADSLLGHANYTYQRVYKLQGVSSSVVRSALESVIAQNSIFRATFQPLRRSFVQMIHPKASLPWESLTGMSLPAYLERSAKKEMPIDEPLIRAAVLDEKFLVVEMHHALFDFWSSQFIIADALTLLQGLSPMARLPFNIYVEHQQSAYNDQAKDFWRNYLSSAASTVVDIPKSDTIGKPFVLRGDLGDSLTRFAKNHAITAGTALHAAWALTLAKVVGSSDVTFMTAFSGRDTDINGILDLNGPTLCTVPLRVRLESSATVLEFTKGVQSNLWNLSKYASTGMRNALSLGAMQSSSFNSMVNLLVKLDEFPEDGLLKPVITHGDNFTQYITMELNHANPSQIKMLVPFAADRVRAQSVLDTFISMLRLMADGKDAPISQLLSEQALARSIDPVNMMAPVQLPALAHTAFESFAAADPTKIAIRTSAGRYLSYAEFNSKANNFAAWLLDHGVRHQEMIPLFMEKSVETLISIVGILKSGASFTPLDPKNSYDRNAFVIKDVGAKRIVTDVKNRDICRAFGVDLIITETMDLARENAQNPEIPELKPDSVVYAIYTSGSTGLPKGVLVQHSAVVASVEGMIEATRVTPEWNSLWVLNYVFDASYYDVFTIFSVGGTLNIAPQDELLYDLAGHINRMNIEQVMLTPTITKLISGGPDQVPHLKVLNVCGERIDADVLKWAESVDVYNGYGPTEATILMTVSKVEPGSSLDSIGHPLKHAYVVIVSSEGKTLEPVADGEVGELCVYGPQLAKGYLNRPEQTTAAFVQDENGRCFYRTGDIARWATDGTLECLGRKDHQIKLNGFRIELGEIENAIVTTGDVVAVVVSLVEVSGKKQLCAFCIFKGDHSAREHKLFHPQDRMDAIRRLTSQLTTISHYMIPALFLPFTNFPTLPSGKTDRKRLVALVENMDRAQIAQYTPKSEDTGDFVPVTTDNEKVMQKAWSSVLGEEESDIGANSVFLSLGGDSISAINLVSACRKLCYIISVSQILSNPTLAEQAKLLQPAQAKQTQVEVVLKIPEAVLFALREAGIAAGAIEDIYPCGPGQTEFLIQGHKEQQFWNLHAFRELSPDFDLRRWRETTTTLTARNQIMRASYIKANANDDLSWYQVILKDPTIDYEEYTYSTEEEKCQHMLDIRASVFALGTPNIKYRVLQSLISNARTLCIKVDHATYDGTLLRIFDEQFKAIARGDSDLPPINSFKHFIDWSATADRKPALDYWKNSLVSYEPQHSLPRQPVSNSLLMAPVTAAVDVVATKFGVTASTVFQATYSLVVARLSGTKDALVDNLLTGRNVDLQDPNTLNGTCANFLPFRSVISTETRTQDFLKDTQATFWDTTAAGTVGLTSIYKALGQDRQVYGAKALYCFQPFEPAPAGAADAMRWIVMAQSKVLMTINYALMVEVQKISKGYRLKVQWDSRAMSEKQVDEMVELFNKTLDTMSQSNKDSSKLVELLEIETGVDAIWR